MMAPNARLITVAESRNCRLGIIPDQKKLFTTFTFIVGYKDGINFLNRYTREGWLYIYIYSYLGDDANDDVDEHELITNSLV